MNNHEQSLISMIFLNFQEHPSTSLKHFKYRPFLPQHQSTHENLGHLASKWRGSNFNGRFEGNSDQPVLDVSVLVTRMYEPWLDHIEVRGSNPSL